MVALCVAAAGCRGPAVANLQAGDITFQILQAIVALDLDVLIAIESPRGFRRD
jgi:hypothetical protein